MPATITGSDAYAPAGFADGLFVGEADVSAMTGVFGHVEVCVWTHDREAARRVAERIALRGAGSRGD